MNDIKSKIEGRLVDCKVLAGTIATEESCDSQPTEGKCTAGDTKCEGNILKTCQNSQWDKDKECDYGCENKACSPETCTKYHETKCINNKTLLVCSNSKKWEKITCDTSCTTKQCNDCTKNDFICRKGNYIRCDTENYKTNTWSKDINGADVPSLYCIDDNGKYKNTLCSSENVQNKCACDTACSVNDNTGNPLSYVILSCQGDNFCKKGEIDAKAGDSNLINNLKSGTPPLCSSETTKSIIGSDINNIPDCTPSTKKKCNNSNDFMCTNDGTKSGYVTCDTNNNFLSFIASQCYDSENFTFENAKCKIGDINKCGCDTFCQEGPFYHKLTCLENGLLCKSQDRVKGELHELAESYKNFIIRCDSDTLNDSHHNINACEKAICFPELNNSNGYQCIDDTKTKCTKDGHLGDDSPGYADLQCINGEYVEKTCSSNYFICNVNKNGYFGYSICKEGEQLKSGNLNSRCISIEGNKPILKGRCRETKKNKCGCDTICKDGNGKYHIYSCQATGDFKDSGITTLPDGDPIPIPSCSDLIK